ncbi:hypothetical protein A2U01_0117588, partial [Trifolium medium]|nr:hypothetical protein [Trifolium medium]
CLWMRNHTCEILFSDPWESEKTVMNRKLNFSDDVKFVTEEEIVVSMNRTAE